jgi:RNA polymerase sigma-70 factor (ECF subfamily)
MGPEISLQTPTHEQLEREVAVLYEEHAAAMLRFAWRLSGRQDTAQEALQEAYLRFFVERSYGHDIRNPKAWLYEVLRNYVCDRMRAVSVQREVTADHMERIQDLHDDPEVMAEMDEMARQIAASLSGRELECLRLRTAGLSYEEIGATMQLRPGTVGAMLVRAYDKIRKRAQMDGGAASSFAGAVFSLVGGREPCIQGWRS